MAQFKTLAEARQFDINGTAYDLIALVQALDIKPEGWTTPESVTELHVGQTVYVWALGNKLRRGIVAKLGRTKATVIFTTQGAVDHNMRYGGGIRVADTAVQLYNIAVPAAAPVEIETPAEPEIEEAPEVEIETPATECPVCGGPLASDGVCADDTCGEEHPECAAKGCDIPEGLGECRVCGAELVEIDQPEALTLNSHDGKVGLNSENETEEPDMASTDTETPIVRELTGSAVVKLLERVHERIRQNHPEVPEVVIVTGAGIGFGGGKWGHFRPQGWTTGEASIHEMFMAGETLAKGSRQVLQTMIHESAHALAEHRGEKDTSRQGRWHNQVFRKTAEELGLEYKGEKADKTLGFSQVTLTAETVEEYKDLLDELDAEIHLMVRLPGWLGGTAGNDGDDEDNGGENMGKAPKTGPASASNNVKLTCECEEPNIIRASKKVAAKMVVNCGDCDALFLER